VLRITREARNGRTRLRLEGRVVGPWVGELAGSCARAPGEGAGLELELAGVSFLDRDGVRLVRRLASRGVTILGCSQFVRAQLEGGQP